MADKYDDQSSQSNRSAVPREERSFLQYAVLFYGVGILFVLVAGIFWRAASVFLLLFACILVAILLYDITKRVQQWLHLPHGLALGLVVILLLGLLGIGGWLMAPQITQQARELMSAIPDAFERLRSTLSQYGVLLSDIASNLPPADQLMSRASTILSKAGMLFSGVLGVIGNIAIIFFVGIYLAAQPHVYIDGIVTMVPPKKRQRAYEVFAELGRTLGQWLFGKVATMIIVGIVTTVGLILLGVPLALVLGILAGLLDFIPYLGPIIAGVPAVLIAFSESPTLSLYVVLLFLGVQIAEGYLLLPLIERRTVSLPPGLLIMMQVLMGALFGLVGVALASPFAAVLVVLISMLYVQDVLGDPVKTPSEH